MLLVDAYNALHVTGVLPPDLAGPDVRGLADLVARSRWRSAGAVLVCDGPGPGGPRRLRPIVGAAIEIRYAGAGRDADSLIELLLERHSAPRRVTVVSSDNRLKAAAKRRKARWMPSEAFLHRLAADARRPDRRGPDPRRAAEQAVPLDPGSVENWIRAFGLSPADLARKARESPRVQQPRSGARPPAAPPASTPPPADDEASLLREAMREWPGRIDPDDLDMRRWLDGPEFHSDD
ncbi:MAG: NYN domain-containing protein [Phycisphaerales bacterium]